MSQNKDTNLEDILIFSFLEKVRINYFIQKHHFRDRLSKRAKRYNLIHLMTYAVFGLFSAIFLFSMAFILVYSPPKSNTFSEVAPVNTANSSQEYPAIESLTRIIYTADNLAISQNQRVITLRDLLNATQASGYFLTPPGVGSSNANEISYLFNSQTGGLALAAIGNSTGGIGVYVYLPSISSHTALYRIGDVYTAHATILTLHTPK
jgi:hypothetical protein